MVLKPKTGLIYISDAGTSSHWQQKCGCCYAQAAEPRSCSLSAVAQAVWHAGYIQRALMGNRIAWDSCLWDSCMCGSSVHSSTWSPEYVFFHCHCVCAETPSAPESVHLERSPARMRRRSISNSSVVTRPSSSAVFRCRSAASIATLGWRNESCERV